MRGGTVAAKDVFKAYWRELRPYRWTTFLVMALISIGEIVGVIAPLYYKQFFDVLSQGITPGATAVLKTALLIILALHILHWILSRTAGWINTHIDTHMIGRLEESAFGYLLGHSYTFFTNSFVGSLVRRVNKYSGGYNIIAENIKWTFLPTSIVIGSSIIVLSQRSVWLALGLFVWVIIYIIANYSFALWKLKYDEIRSNLSSATTAIVADSLTNSNNIKIFSAQEHERGILAQAMNKWRKAALFAWHLSDLNEALQWMLMTLLEFGIMILAVNLWQQGLLTIGDFALIQSYLISVFVRVWDLGRTIRKTYEAVADAKEMVEIMQTPHEIRDRKGAKEMMVKKGRIVFQNVFFRYSSKSRQVLNGLNLNIRPQEKVALVGPSGAGKSTVVKLILRFHDIQKGKISIDGHDIKQVTQDSLREAIAMVPQDPVLFHRSLMDNIRYGRRDASDEEVMEAAKKAHCHEFITELPEGYNTFVGERGIKLSGGERQRVAIARAILKDAPILILDEATSSLDSESEQLIQDALSELMKNKTTIVIAHRLSTILKMDRIAVVAGGKMVDQGTHTQLIKKPGIYKTLWDIQAGGFLVQDKANPC